MAARIAGGGHGAHGRAVVGAITRQDLEALAQPPVGGGAARQFDGVLVGVRPAEREQDLAEFSAGSHVRDSLARQRANLRRHARRGVGEFLGLLLHRLDDALVAVPDVDAHGHRVEIEVALVVHVPEIDAFGALDRDRVHFGLRRPGIEDVLFGKRQDLVIGKIEHGDLGVSTFLRIN